MSGFAGIWNLNGEAVEYEILKKVNSTLSLKAEDGEENWIKDAFGLGFKAVHITPESVGETQPLVHPSGFALAFNGRLDNREELLASLKSYSALSSRCIALETPL